MPEKQNKYKKRGVDYQISVPMLTLPREYYHSEAIYREELEKIFYQRWLFVCREEEIPEKGSYLTVNIGDESVLVVRDDLGSIKAHMNVCRHRGTRICEKESGCFPNGIIQCPYHAWRYDLRGRLKATPLMKDQPDFNKADYPRYRFRVRSSSIRRHSAACRCISH